MCRIVLILLVASLLASCSTTGRKQVKSANTRCGGDGISQTNLFYGEAELRFTPKLSLMRPGDDLLIKLHPRQRRGDPVNYENSLVTVSGKDPASAWIAGNETYSVNDELIICVPSAQPRGDYEFIVNVENVGELDPRANVY